MIKVHCFSIYKIPLQLNYGTREELNRYMKRNNFDPLNDTAAANYRIYPEKVHVDERHYCLISLVKASSGISEICNLLHEVLHYAIYTFGQIEIPVTDLHEEPFCYFVESMMHQCLEGIKNKGKAS